MRKDIFRALVFKFIALGVLWYLFFSDAHRPNVDAAAVGHRLAVAPPAGGAAAESRSSPSGSVAHD